MMDVATDDKPTIYEYGSAGTKFDGYAYEIFQNTEEIVCTYKRKTPWTVEGEKEADGCLRFWNSCHVWRIDIRKLFYCIDVADT